MYILGLPQFIKITHYFKYLAEHILFIAPVILLSL